MLRYAKQYWYYISLSFSLTIITSLVNAFIPVIGTQKIIDEVLVQQYYDRLGYYLLLIIGMYVVTSIISFIQRYVNSYTSQKIVFDIRNELFAALQKKSFSFYDQTQTGQLISRTTSDVDRIRMFYSFWMSSLFGSIIQVIFVAYFLLGMDFRLTLITMIPFPFIFILNYRYMRRVHPIYRNIRQQFGILNSILQQNIVGIKVVRVFTGENLEMQKFKDSNDTFFGLSIEAARQSSLYQPLIIFFLSLGSLLAFNQYITMLTRPVRFLGYLITLYSRALAAGKRVFEIIDSEPEIKDKPTAYELTTVKGSVTFNNVSFGYDENRLILHSINLSVREGETIAILGATGSGKSSLIYLIPRFYDVTHGNITIDNHDIRDISLNSLRKQIGIVLQDIFLFSTTIQDNIAFGKPNTTMEEIIRAAKLAQAHDFIMSFPKGYDTVVGERGITLSGGQKQRIAIARTLLMNPKILIMDDSTSFVDTRTEQAIQEALSILLKERTTFIITQRLSTIKNADTIIVLDNGKIIEEGTHEELLTLDGIYSQIYNTQFALQEEILVSAAETKGG